MFDTFSEETPQSITSLKWTSAVRTIRIPTACHRNYLRLDLLACHKARPKVRNRQVKECLQLLISITAKRRSRMSQKVNTLMCISIAPQSTHLKVVSPRFPQKNPSAEISRKNKLEATTHVITLGQKRWILEALFSHVESTNRGFFSLPSIGSSVTSSAYVTDTF